MRGRCWLIGLYLFATLILANWPVFAASNSELGRQLFHGFLPFSAGNAVTNTRRPADLVACYSCHGAQAVGKIEGGLKVPAVRWQNLSASSNSGIRYGSEADLRAAITLGIGRAGKPLNTAMPRYQLTQVEADAMIDYLRIAGTVEDLPRGVSPTTIRLGIMVPLSGPLQGTGEKILRGASNVATAVNESGGVHGRKIQLITVDSYPDADLAAQALVEEAVN